MILDRNNSPEALHPYLDEINDLYDVYIQVMHLKKIRGELKGRKKIMAYLFFAYGYIKDIYFNLVTATRIFNDWPRELIFTARLKRYREGNDLLWREAIAEFLCDSVLDQGDPSGDHC